jgi:hypothetical protein
VLDCSLQVRMWNERIEEVDVAWSYTQNSDLKRLDPFINGPTIAYQKPTRATWRRRLHGRRVLITAEAGEKGVVVQQCRLIFGELELQGA